MKVKELIKQLEQQDPELEVLCFSEDEDILPHDEDFRLFQVKKVVNSEDENKDESVSSSGKIPRTENHVSVLLSSD
ncbi:MAG: hypothetical protein WEA56_14600 [Balneolaceae bacterium]